MPLDKGERAKKAYDLVQMYNTIHGKAGLDRWLAISLADGSCDLKPYASKQEAVRFQLHETQCAYLYLSGIPTLGEMRYFLDTCEELFDAGLKLADPDTYVNPETFL